MRFCLQARFILWCSIYPGLDWIQLLFFWGCILSMSLSWLPYLAPVSRKSRIVKSEKSEF